MSDPDVSAHEEIRSVLARYARGIDMRDFELVARCFAPDARAAYSGQELSGVDAIIAYVRRVERFRATTHVITNVVIDVHGESASARSQAIAHMVSSDAAPDAVVMRGLRYDDELATIDGTWVITDRIHRADWSATVSAAKVETPPER